MYHHVKKLMYTVRVDSPDPKFGNMLLEQFGGAIGELAAAMQYSIQGLNCEDAERKDLLMDIGTEEPSHPEGVAARARPPHTQRCETYTRIVRNHPLFFASPAAEASICSTRRAIHGPLIT